jgi:hypothetical protein
MRSFSSEAIRHHCHNTAVAVFTMRTALACILSIAVSVPAFAVDLVLTPKVTVKNASHDPMGVWTDSDLAQFGIPRHHPDILTASKEADGGTWILTTISRGNLQSVAPFVLLFRSVDGHTAVKASGEMGIGSSATLRTDKREIETESLDGRSVTKFEPEK